MNYHGETQMPLKGRGEQVVYAHSCMTLSSPEIQLWQSACMLIF